MTAIWTNHRYLTSTLLGSALGRGLPGISDRVQLHGNALPCSLDSLNI